MSGKAGRPFWSARLAMLATVLVCFVGMAAYFVISYPAAYQALSRNPQDWERYMKLNKEVANWLYSPIIIMLGFAYAKGGRSTLAMERRTHWRALDGIAVAFVALYSLVPILLLVMYNCNASNSLNLLNMQELIDYLNDLFGTVLTIFLGFYFGSEAPAPPAATAIAIAEPNQ